MVGVGQVPVPRAMADAASLAVFCVVVACTVVTVAKEVISTQVITNRL